MYYILSDLKIVLASVAITLPVTFLLTFDFSKLDKKKKKEKEN